MPLGWQVLELAQPDYSITKGSRYFILYKDNSLIDRVENNFINVYNKFEILEKKLNNYHIEIGKINQMIDIIISNEYTKIYKTYYPMKNYDLVQDKFFYI